MTVRWIDHFHPWQGCQFGYEHDRQTVSRIADESSFPHLGKLPTLVIPNGRPGFVGEVKRCALHRPKPSTVNSNRTVDSSFGIMKDTFGDDWHWQIDHDQFASLFAYFLFITKGREAPVGDHLAPLGCAGGPSAAPKRD
jgi:hypothetical protein